MNGRPSSIRVLGSSLVGNPFAPQFRAYKYNGSEPYVPPVNPAIGEGCIADGCSKKRHSRDYCDRHHRNVKLYGTPFVPDRRRKENRHASNGS